MSIDQAAYKRAYRLAHPEEVRAADRARYATHRESRLAAVKAQYAAKPERALARARAFYAAQPPLVYVWVGPDGQADYVGRGTGGRATIHRTQSGRASWWTNRHILLTMTCDSEWQAMEYEGKWGARYLPRHNREGYRHAG